MSRRFRHSAGDVQGLLTKSRIIVVIFLCFWFYAADGGANPSSMELVRADMTLKGWDREFKALAANLSELKIPTPKLPTSDFVDALTADENELSKLHRTYIRAIKQEILTSGEKSSTEQ